MADFKLVIADAKTGKCIQKELKSPDSNNLIGKKIGEKIEGSLVGFEGYEFEITGGSDYCGFPMRSDVHGLGRKKVLSVEGVGIRKAAKGIKQRKTVCGNTIHEKIVQINLKILKEGSIKFNNFLNPSDSNNPQGKEKLFVDKPKENKEEAKQ